ESDLAFLGRILARFDADVQVVEDRLQAGPIAGEARATLRLAMGNQLLRARITADLADQGSEVRVGSFDPATGQPVLGTATSGTLGPGQGQDGPSLLRPLLDPAREHVGHQAALTESEARQLAGTVDARQDPDSLSRVQVQLLGPDADNEAPIWARVAVPFAGDNYGAFLIPDVEQEVLVLLVAGDARSAVVMGALWNGATGIPETIG